MSHTDATQPTTGDRPPLRSRIFRHPLAHLFAALLVIGLTQSFVAKLFMVPSGSMERTLEVGDRILVNRMAYGPPGVHGTPANGDIVAFTSDDALWPRPAPSENGSLIASAKYGIKFVFGDLIGIGPTTGHTLVKRVIGLPGQKVACCGTEGKLTVNGAEIDEPYIYEDYPFEPGTLDCTTTPASLRCFPEVTVPDGLLLVLGDHRSNSGDSVTSCRGTTQSEAGGAAACVKWVRQGDVFGEVFGTVWPLNRFGAVE